MSISKAAGDTIYTPENSLELIAKLVFPQYERPPLIGNELEVFVVNRVTGYPINFATHQKLLSQLPDRLRAYKQDFEPGYERDPNRGVELLTHLKGIGRQTGSIICGEPGCQIEGAPAPVDNLHDAAAATETFLSALIDVAESSGHAVVIPGLHPLCRGHDIPLSGRPRYRALQSRIEAVPEGYGHDLSRGTCGLQVNVDTTPKTWLTIVQVSYLIQPVLTALFANAAAFDRKPTANCHSNRAVLWFEHWGNNLKRLRDLIADKNFSAAAFAAYALEQEVPILVRAQGDIPLEGIRLIDLIDPTKKPPGIGAITERDVANILGTFYGEIKIKPYGLVELRGADASYELRHALSALAVGLLYDSENLRAAHDLVGSWNEEERDHLAYQAPRQGLDAFFTSGTIRNIALTLCESAYAGLVRRNQGEEIFLNPLLAIARGEKQTPAEAFLVKAKEGRSTESLFAESFLTRTTLKSALALPGQRFITEPGRS